MLLLAGIAGGMSILQAQVGFGISAGYRGGSFKSAGFNRFRESYNAYYRTQMKQELGGFGLGAGYALNADMTAGNVVIGMRYANYAAKDLAEFNHGGKREFRMQESLFATALGFGVQRSAFHFHATGALLIGTNRIRSAYIYSDGTRSYGSDASLNGFYEAIRFGWSGRVEFSIGPVYLASEYVFGKVSGIGLALDGSFQEPGIPTDYSRWVQQGSLNYGTDDYVLPDFNGLRYEIGLRWNLGE